MNKTTATRFLLDLEQNGSIWTYELFSWSKLKENTEKGHAEQRNRISYVNINFSKGYWSAFKNGSLRLNLWAIEREFKAL